MPGPDLRGPDVSRHNNLDALRLLAATGVIVSHAAPIASGPRAPEWLSVVSHGQTTLGGLCVGVFFIISGYLITQSFDRSARLRDYAARRAARIVPGLAVVVALMALVVGPLDSVLAPWEYFSHGEVWRYLIGMSALRVYHRLPGVFADHAYPHAVNGSIWTLPYEMWCYVAVALVGLAWRRRWLLLVGVAIYAVLAWRLGKFDWLYVVEFGLRFSAGALAYLARDRFVFRGWLAWLGVIALSGTMLSGVGYAWAAAVVLPYVVLWAGLGRPWPTPDWLRRNDLSYGVYLYGWPVQQMVAPWSGTALGNIAVALPLVFACAAASWFVVERPMLRLTRRRFGSTKTGMLTVSGDGVGKSASDVPMQESSRPVPTAVIEMGSRASGTDGAVRPP